MRAFVYWFPSLILNGTRLGLGASHYHFVKEIPIGTRYEIRVNIVGWEEKWIHLVAQFVTYPKKRGQASKEADGRPQPARESSTDSGLSSGVATPLRTNAPQRSSLGLHSRRASLRNHDSGAETSLASPPDSSSSSDNEDDGLFEDASQSSISTPPTSAGSTSPLMKTARTLGEAGLAAASSSLASQAATEAKASGLDANALPQLPEGAVLHCVHVSSYCFKQGRITVPPRVALVAAGFGDPEVGRAQRVKDITNTLSRSSVYRTVGSPVVPKTHTIPELMGSEWRRYEGEGLWDLPEYEERNRAGVERYRPLRQALDTLRL